MKEKVEGDYEQTSPPSSNDWHFVKITAKPGSDKVFTIHREYTLIFVSPQIFISIIHLILCQGVHLEEQGGGRMGSYSHQYGGERGGDGLQGGQTC